MPTDRASLVCRLQTEASAMSMSDPMKFASHASEMSDREIFDGIHAFGSGESDSDFNAAIFDEAQLRGMLSASEVDAIMASDRSAH
jgi:hypothetical protein